MSSGNRPGHGDDRVPRTQQIAWYGRDVKRRAMTAMLVALGAFMYHSNMIGVDTDITPRKLPGVVKINGRLGRQIRLAEEGVVHYYESGSD